MFFTNIIKENRKLFTPMKVAMILLGTAFVSFGLYNIHQQTDITEGGILGLTLLLNYWLGLKPSTLSLILDLAFYFLAYKYLGKDFIKLSILASVSLAGFLRLWEQFPPMLPNLSSVPFIASLLGGLFVGVGVGLVVRQGGASGGDDALALTISRLTNCRISFAYLITDTAVLLMSLSYIPLHRIVYSLLTVIISSLVIDLVQNAGKKNWLPDFNFFAKKT
ncbi:YitT family protein [Ureibacillus aquaedulcis]|uniref:YitT family protein n=1 Tax=Ureibacillus aquaedulcis TaxID=3058421 RepID=A0ABT8GSS4_9BACL|nr:YitT family protein [Ureibacillus sp. BA0131]MDN4494466.1 YitT family protein [Ureibacillus sp. BA0131]